MRNSKSYTISLALSCAFILASMGIFFAPQTQISDQQESSVGESPMDPTLSLREGKLKSRNFKVGQSNSREYYQFVKGLDSFYAVQRSRGWNGAVLVAYQGKPLYNTYIGYKNYATREMIQPNTSFQLASTSKPFTAVSILMLQEQGKLTIYDDVRKYIPDFPYSGVTIKNLLSHTSGMQDYINFAGNYWNEDKQGWMGNEDLLEMLATKKPSMIFRPGTRFKYTNTNYAVLASIVERVSGLPFKIFLNKNIFGPLRMTNTYVNDPRDEYPSNASLCYKGGWNEYKFNYQDGVFGDKGVFSTVNDMLKFDQALYTTALLSRNSLLTAYSPQVGNLMRSPKNYGLGWRMYNYPTGEKIVYHNGLWHGNNSCFYRFIQDGFAIIIQCNKFTSKTYDQPSAICDILAKIEGIDNDLDL